MGVGTDKPELNLGRCSITKEEKDWGAFKVPNLRESARTAPYMHDRNLKTLEEVVEYYDKGGTPNRNLDPLIFPLQSRGPAKKPPSSPT